MLSEEPSSPLSTALDSRYRNEKDPLDPLHLLLRFLYTTFLIGKADYAAPTS
jgi:hypothetical protein